MYEGRRPAQVGSDAFREHADEVVGDPPADELGEAEPKREAGWDACRGRSPVGVARGARHATLSRRPVIRKRPQRRGAASAPSPARTSMINSQQTLSLASTGFQYLMCPLCLEQRKLLVNTHVYLAICNALE